MQPTITMTDTPEPHVRKAIVGLLIDFNNSRASQPEDYRPLVIVLSNPDTGGVLGGLKCWSRRTSPKLEDCLK
jgi:hypothetical protein